MKCNRAWAACLGALLALGGAACSDESTPVPSVGTDSGTPPPVDAGGMEDAGPPTDSGPGNDGGGDASMCNVETITDELLDQAFAPCDCPGAHCVGAALIPESQRAELSVPCKDPSQLCVPDPLIKTNGNYRPPTCTSIAGYEGRCMSKCLATVQALSAGLPSDNCADTDLCVPCYDPFGNSTTACDLACDTPPSPPVTPGCCAENNVPQGTCVPEAFLALQITDPDELADTKAQLQTCTNNDICVPNAFAAGRPEPARCDATAFTIFRLGEGACTPKCVKTYVNLPIKPDQSTCAANEFCAPCRAAPSDNPFGTPVPTGACPWDPIVTEEPPAEESAP